jgi:HAD superfamily hydrolase (TIGR01509 family)
VAAAHLKLRWSMKLLRTYRTINAEMWRAYQRGEIDPGTLSRERFSRLLGELGRDAAHGGAMGEAYLSALSQRGDVLPGARSTLAAVARKFRIAAVTNGIDRVQRDRLASARLADRFEVVVTSEGCGFAKPDPRIIREALSRLGATAEEAVYVGDDAVADGGATRAAGVRFWWIDRGLGGEPPSVMDARLASVRGVTALLGASAAA